MGGMPIPGIPSRAELVDHLVRTRIAGDVATPRENNLSHYRKLANGERHYWLGLELGDRWTDEQDVLAVMAERVGVNDDPEYRYGPGHHRPRADGRRAGAAGGPAAQGGRGAAAGAVRDRPPGRPAGRAPRHGRRAARGRLRDRRHPGRAADGRGYVCQFADVAVLEHGATLWHTHSGEPMAAILTALDREGRPLPDLVVADHGWAGYAASTASTRSVTPTATTRRCSSARRRARSRWPSRWTTTCRARATTTR